MSVRLVLTDTDGPRHWIFSMKPGCDLHRQLDRKRWAAARRAVFRRAGEAPRYEQRGRLSARFQVDHRTPLHRGGDPYSLENLALLCSACHAENRRGEPVPGFDRMWQMGAARKNGFHIFRMRAALAPVNTQA